MSTPSSISSGSSRYSSSTSSPTSPLSPKIEELCLSVQKIQQIGQEIVKTENVMVSCAHAIEQNPRGTTHRGPQLILARAKLKQLEQSRDETSRIGVAKTMTFVKEHGNIVKLAQALVPHNCDEQIAFLNRIIHELVLDLESLHTIPKQDDADLSPNEQDSITKLQELAGKPDLGETEELKDFVKGHGDMITLAQLLFPKKKLEQLKFLNEIIQQLVDEHNSDPRLNRKEESEEQTPDSRPCMPSRSFTASFHDRSPIPDEEDS